MQAHDDRGTGKVAEMTEAVEYESAMVQELQAQRWKIDAQGREMEELRSEIMKLRTDIDLRVTDNKNTVTILARETLKRVNEIKASVAQV